MGLHALRQARGSPPSTRRDGTSSTTSAWAICGSSRRHSALDPGSRSGRVRVPAGVRRWRIRRRQHLPDQRLVQAHAERCPGQEFRRAGLVVRPHARPWANCISLRRLVPGPLDSARVPAPPPCRNSFSHRMMAQEPIKTKSGTVRITDSSVFAAGRPRPLRPWWKLSQVACGNCCNLYGCKSVTYTDPNTVSRDRACSSRRVL